jgi:hypothetical protein
VRDLRLLFRRLRAQPIDPADDGEHDAPVPPTPALIEVG